jgi:nucleoside 2-deoxyribosyltransferase
MKKSIYLAGPDVFLSNALEIGKQKVELCEKYGFIGHFPLDIVIKELSDKNLSPYSSGLLISKVNEDKIKESDIILANLTPFRSPSADVGTVYEIGFGRGCNKLLCGYSNVSKLYIDRVAANFSGHNDNNGMEIENFQMFDNVMIDGGIVASGGFIVVKDVKYIYTDLTVFEKCLSKLKYGL